MHRAMLGRFGRTGSATTSALLPCAAKGAFVLDRLISGAGAVTDAADRAVRLLVGGWRGGFAMTRPGSIVVAGLLLVLAGILVAAGLEVTAPTTPVALDPAGVATARDLGDRTYSTMTGSLSTTWIETFDDANANGIEDGDETGDAWFYWLVDPVGRRGVTVRSERSPAEIFTYRGRGSSSPTRRTAPRNTGRSTTRSRERASPWIPRWCSIRRSPSGNPSLWGRSGPFPASGTAVELSGARTGSYLAVCSVDSDRNGRCDADDQDRYEIVGLRPGDPARHPGARASATRIQRRDRDRAPPTRGAGGGRRADEPGFRFHGARSPGLGPLPARRGRPAGQRAAGVRPRPGVSGPGRDDPRRAGRRLPHLPTLRRRAARPGDDLGPGERLPLRITGVLRTPTGREHVREVPGELVRFVLGRPVVPAVDVARGGRGRRADRRWRAPERRSGRARGRGRRAARGRRAGRARPRRPDRDDAPRRARRPAARVSAVGLGEVRRLSIGQAMAFRGARPALRILAGTGLVVLSFDTPGDRDRAAAELLAETGLGRHDIDPTPDTREEPDGRLGIH